jgi:hypothetical protein
LALTTEKSRRTKQTMAMTTGTTMKIVGALFLLAYVAIMQIKNTTREADPSSVGTKNTKSNNASSISASDSDSSYDNIMCQHLNERLPQHISELYQQNTDFFQKHIYFFKKKRKKRKKKNMKKNHSPSSIESSESLSPSSIESSESLSPSSESSESLFKSVLMDGIHHQSSSLPLSSQNKTYELDLSKALISPFRGKKIVLIGDSTLRNLFFGLKTLMNSKYPIINDIDILTYGKIYKAAEIKGKKYINKQKQAHFGVVDDVNEVDMHYTKIYAIQEITDELYQSIDSEMDGADLVVFNVGLHILHLIGTNLNVRPLSPDAYGAWINYELFIKDFIKFLMKKKPKIILIKTTNRICEGKFKGPWLDLSKKYNSNNNETINYCVDHVLRKTKSNTINNKTAITTNQISKLCKFGTLTSKGSIYLNERMKNVINDIQIHDDEFISSNITLGIFNDHDLDPCELTDDGRHYPKTMLSRINLLANMLNCLL